MKQFNSPSTKAFTLIELSMVLVIIGLIVGGVLVGNDLIEATKLRRVVSEQEKFSTAVMTFKLKYNAIPGDITNATQFWGADASCPNTTLNTTPKAATCNGNGDGKVYPISIPNTSVQSERYETFRFWQQLANAGLIEGSFTGVGHGNDQDGTPGLNVPKSSYSEKAGWGVYGLWGNGDGSSGFAGVAYGSNLIFIGMDRTSFLPNDPLFTAQQASNIDIKFDNGLPATGRISVNESPCTTTNVAATAQYNTSNTAIICAMWFKAGF